MPRLTPGRPKASWFSLVSATSIVLPSRLTTFHSHTRRPVLFSRRSVQPHHHAIALLVPIPIASLLARSPTYPSPLPQLWDRTATALLPANTAAPPVARLA